MPHVLHTIWLDSHEPTNKDTLWIKPLKKDYYGIFVYGSNGWVLTTALFKGTIGEFVIDQLPEATIETNGVMAAQDKRDLEMLKDALANIDVIIEAINNIDQTPTEGSQHMVTSGGVYESLEGKVDVVDGKGLSTEDFTSEEKNKLASIPDDIINGIQSDWNTNNNDSVSYIKNRTHWEENGVVHKLHPKFLDMDTAPTSESTKPVTSGGVKEALAGYVTSAALATALTGKVGSETIHNIVELTQAEYDALQTKRGDTMYITTDTTKVYIGSRIIKENVKANEEDIDFDSSDKLQFADRVYNSSTPDGLGYVILRKNKTFAQQVTATNTIYEIRYDFDLGGDEVTIPAGCMLKFDGGCLMNGTLVGNGTDIKSQETTIFKDIIIADSGVWNVSDLYSKWFESSNEAVYSTIDNLLHMNNGDINTNIFILGDYDYVPSYVYDTKGVKSNTSFYVKGAITNIGSQNSKNLFDFGANAKNVSFYGGTYIGNLKNTDDSTTPNIEYGHCFMFREAENILFDGCTIRDFTGDGICASAVQYPEEVNKNITIKNCTIDRASRNGITIIAAKNVVIENCTFKNITRKSPKAAIDLEPNYSTQPSENIRIDNCKVENCVIGFGFSNHRHAQISNIVVSNTIITATTVLSATEIERLSIIQCQFTSTATTFITNCNNVLIENSKISCPVSMNLSGTSNSVFYNNILNVPIYFAQGLIDNNYIEISTGFFTAGSSLPLVLRNNTIKCKALGGLNNAHDMVIEKNNIMLYDTSNIPNYFIIGGMKNKDSRAIIRDNVFDINASTRHIHFQPACNLDISNNIIKVGSDHPVIYVDSSNNIPLKNVSGNGNVFILPDRFTSKVYSAFNSLTYVSNKAGDTQYFDKIKKYATFNGTKWLDKDGYTAALSRGATADRPTASLYGSDSGFMYYDEELGKPIYFKSTVGASVISIINVAINIVDNEYYGVTKNNTLNQGEDYKLEITTHPSRWVKVAFRKTDNAVYDDADELLICESNAKTDNVFIKAPDPTIYPYIFVCNCGNIVITAYIKNVTMGWIDATGASV